MLEILLVLIVTLVMGYLIFKGYKAQTMLFAGGLVLMLFSVLFDLGPIIDPELTTGWTGFDFFEYITQTMSTTLSGLGLTIMAVSGFSRFMDHMGASEALVRLSTKPLSKINAPYILLLVAIILAQILFIFVPSASGLGVLLMVTLYPILKAAGLSNASAATPVAMAAVFDFGPAAPPANLVSQMLGIDVTLFFTNYQLPVYFFAVIGLLIVTYFTSRYFDKQEGYEPGIDQVEDVEESSIEVPGWYAIFPVIPLILILLFSDFVIAGIEMNVVTAMIISFAIAFIVHMLRNRFSKESVEGIQIFFNGMGIQLATVVSIIFAANTFANGLTSTGAIDIMINAVSSLDSGPVLVVTLMSFIALVVAVVTGSGDAPFFAFAPLAPAAAEAVSMDPLQMLVPMQFSTSIGRTMSPVAGVIIAVAGEAELSPFQLVKRTAIPMLVTFVLSIIGAFIFLG